MFKSGDYKYKKFSDLEVGEFFLSVGELATIHGMCLGRLDSRKRILILSHTAEKLLPMTHMLMKPSEEPALCFGANWKVKGLTPITEFSAAAEKREQRGAVSLTRFGHVMAMPTRGDSGIFYYFNLDNRAFVDEVPERSITFDGWEITKNISPTGAPEVLASSDGI